MTCQSLSEWKSCRGTGDAFCVIRIEPLQNLHSPRSHANPMQSSRILHIRNSLVGVTVSSVLNNYCPFVFVSELLHKSYLISINHRKQCLSPIGNLFSEGQWQLDNTEVRNGCTVSSTYLQTFSTAFIHNYLQSQVDKVKELMS